MIFWQSALHKFQTVRLFSLREWGLLFEAWIALAQADLILRVGALKRLKLIASISANDGDATQENLQEGLRLQRMVSSASQLFLPPATCLRRSLALRQMLKRRGIAAILRIGVQKGGSSIRAHAWVEMGGYPIGEPPDVSTHFQVLKNERL